jgi:isopentenyl-diphosphate delta-isomerase
MIEADAIVLHLNPLQEALQQDGTANFSGLAGGIAAVCASVGVPVIVKEVGFGISADVARRLVDCGVSAIDVSGAGGTSWSAVEHYRATTVAAHALSRAFFDWGIPTAASLQMVRTAVPDLPLIASGGLRTGIDAAKGLALGATLAGFAGPLLRAAALGETEAMEALEGIVAELRLAMFCTGSRALAALTPDLLFESDPPANAARPEPVSGTTHANGRNGRNGKGQT